MSIYYYLSSSDVSHTINVILVFYNVIVSVDTARAIPSSCYITGVCSLFPGARIQYRVPLYSQCSSQVQIQEEHYTHTQTQVARNSKSSFSSS